MIRGADIDAFKNGIGIMTHANVSDNVKTFVREFPSSDGFYEGQDDDTVKENEFVKDGKLTEKGRYVRDNTVRMCDSGVFTKEGSDFESYENLFRVYENEVHTDYGIILDVLNDSEATVETARDAIEEYESDDYTFKLVGVAQGTSIEEYKQCYQCLKDLGYEYIAVGGLLTKNGERNGAFASVSKEEHMFTILSELRGDYSEDWLFALGCHHPTRHHKFEELDLFGSDYKGWLYRYTPDNERGKIGARRWRYKQTRSFIRTNILANSFSPGTDKLLILSCSDRKSDEGGKIPALERYGGVYYRTLKKRLREDTEDHHNLDILIMSAKYGLIPPHYRIEDYDVEMDEDRQRYLKEDVEVEIRNHLRYRDYEEIYVVAGKEYRQVIVPRLVEEVDDEVTVRVDKNNLFGKLSNLKEWLLENSRQPCKTDSVSVGIEDNSGVEIVSD